MNYIKHFRWIILSVILFSSTVWAIPITPDAVIATNATYSCTTSATIALARNSTRRSWLVVAPITNTVNVFIGFTSSLTTANGVPLGPSNALFDSTYIGPIYCIVASGTQSIIVSETKRCPTPVTAGCT